MDSRDHASDLIGRISRVHVQMEAEGDDDDLEQLEVDVAPQLPSAPSIAKFGIDPNGPRMCYLIPTQGPISVVPWKGMRQTFDFDELEHKNLGESRVGPYGKLYYALYFDGHGVYTQRDNRNSHLCELLGPAYIVAHFEADECYEGADAWWATYSEETHFGYPIPPKAMPDVLEELYFNVLMYFNIFERVRTEFCNKITRKSQELPDILRSRVHQMIRAHIEKFRHPEVERITLAPSFFFPTRTVNLLKSWEALKAFCDTVAKDYNNLLQVYYHNLDFDVCCFAVRPAKIEELRQMRLPHADLKLKQIGQALAPAFIQLQQAFLHSYERSMDAVMDAVAALPSELKVKLAAALDFAFPQDDAGVLQDDAHDALKLAAALEGVFYDAPPPQNDAGTLQDDASPPQNDAGTLQDDAPREEDAASPEDTHGSSSGGMTAHERAYWLNYKAEQAELRAKEAKRKLRAAEERERRATQGDAYVYRPALPQVSKKAAKKAARQQRTQEQRQMQTQNELAHGVHSLPETHALAQARFAAKQAWEHAERIAQEARTRAERAIKLEKDMSASKEAATHCVPPAPTLGDVLSKAMGKSKIKD